MTNEQIKAAINARCYTIKAFAEILGVSYESLRQALSGRKPLTEQLRRHIMLALKETGYKPGLVYYPAIQNGIKSDPIPLTLPLSLPAEILPVIDAAAASQGISSEEYIENICVQFAKQVARGINQARIIFNE